MSTGSTVVPARPPRLTSLDQFRGYTMFGMLLVNLVGGYKLACPYVLRHHHDYCSYADTIMPHFLFAAGFAMRLSLGRRLEAGGKMPWGRAIRRVLGLALVAIGWYGFCSMKGIYKGFQDALQHGEILYPFLYTLFKRELYQTLLHIAVTSLWILPVITAPWKVRVWYAIGSGVLHVVLSWWFNYAWVYSDPSGIDGGPLGFLTWSIPAICGTLACDAVRASGTGATLRIASWGLVVMLIGWGLSIGTTLYNVPAAQVAAEAAVADEAAAVAKALAEVPADATKPEIAPPPAPRPAPKPMIQVLDPKKYAPDPVVPTWERLKQWDGTIVEPPFVRPPDIKHRRWNYWMMSQRGGTLSYPTFAAGFSLVIYALFLWVCDGLKWRLGLFRTLGTNSLAAYVLHDVSGWIPIGGKTIEGYFPPNSTYLGGMLIVFGVQLLFVYAVCRLLERLGWYIRV